MALCALPPELVLHIAHFLDYASEINALARTNRYFFTVLDCLLYSLHSQEEDGGSLALQWAATHGSEPALLKLLAMGIQPSIEAMLLASTFGHEQIVALLHDRGVDVNSQGMAAWPPGLSVEETDYENGCKGTPLWRAVKRRREDCVRLLLDRGADVQFSMSEDGYTRENTLLDLAARKGHTAVMGMLIDAARRKSLDLAPEKMVVWLVNAIEQGNAALTRVLVNAGCEVNGPSALSPPLWFPHHLSNPPIFTAASEGSLEIVDILLDAGASPSAGDILSGSTPVDTAASNGHGEVVNLLLVKGSRPSAAGLFSLLHGNRKDMFELLLPWIDLAQIASNDEYARATVLTAAAGFGLLPLVAQLISQGWDANGAPAADGSVWGRGKMGNVRIPLAWAARHGHLDVFQLLLEHGADPFCFPGTGADDAQPSGISIILEAAINGGHAEIVSYLLNRGADVRTTITPYHEPILFRAIRSEPIFKLLLDHGADPTVRGGGNNPLASTVIRRGTPEVVQLMCERGIDFSSLRTFVPMNGGNVPDHELTLLELLAEATEGIPLVHTLLEHGGLNPDPATDPRLNASALLAAVGQANLPYLRVLLSRGFNPRETPGLEAHLLCDAASLPQPDKAAVMLDFLLAEGELDIEAQNGRGQTALLYAIVGEFYDAPADAVPLLLSRGANPIFRNSAGDSPLKGACRFRNTEALEALLGALDTRQVPLQSMEGQLREAIDILREDLRFEWSVKYLKVLRRFYWRRRYPC